MLKIIIVFGKGEYKAGVFGKKEGKKGNIEVDFGAKSQGVVFFKHADKTKGSSGRREWRESGVWNVSGLEKDTLVAFEESREVFRGGGNNNGGAEQFERVRRARRDPQISFWIEHDFLKGRRSIEGEFFPIGAERVVGFQDNTVKIKKGGISIGECSAKVKGKIGVLRKVIVSNGEAKNDVASEPNRSAVEGDAANEDGGHGSKIIEIHFALEIAGGIDGN